MLEIGWWIVFVGLEDVDARRDWCVLETLAKFVPFS
jgi:hypothetical protein